MEIFIYFLNVRLPDGSLQVMYANTESLCRQAVQNGETYSGKLYGRNVRIKDMPNYNDYISKKEYGGQK